MHQEGSKHVQRAPCPGRRRPGVRVGGGGSFLINLGVLVTYIQTPSPPAVRVRCRVWIRVSTNIMV